MKIILFGGSFDPIHIGHLKIAEKAIESINADKLIFIPTFLSPHKDKTDATSIDRYNMINLILENNNKFDISDYEINKSEMSFSFQTIKHFKEIYPNDELYLLIGNDQLENFHNWKENKYILENIKIICAHKKDDAKYIINTKNIIFINNDLCDISSTKIKEKNCINNLDSKIISYINENGIYYNYRVLPFMNEQRFLHSLRVAQMAKKLANNHCINEKQAWVAGLYHDISKESKELISIARENNIIIPTKEKLLHGIIGSIFIKKYYNFNDQLILNAIARHTKPYDYGFGEISDLDMLIYCCDKLEPMRNDEDINNIDYYRKLIKEDLKKTFLDVYEQCESKYKEGKKC